MWPGILKTLFQGIRQKGGKNDFLKKKSKHSHLKNYSMLGYRDQQATGFTNVETEAEKVERQYLPEVTTGYWQRKASL